MKPARKRPEAQKDIEDAVVYYARQSLELSGRFIGEIKVATGKIEKMSGIGSLRFSHDLGVPLLRVHPLRDFPYLLLYFERADHIDLVRVMHSHRDFSKLLLGIK